ncbi:hypothetical protein [Aurantibacillus circumpalustris]|uniref:hypothetical protein n=1 Tax=Aurantibacillus circumpalustris TaxID=3036359 RepID=UPI00295B2E83|nr:hypothetical protein [Aurantibacillus circumpalustris]
MKSFLVLFSGILISAFVLTGVSCQKETDCKATIKCVDSLGSVVANARVQLYAVVKDPNDPKGIATFTADVKADGNTDGGGEVKFTFKLPAIYDIKATSTLGSKTYTGASIVKLEEGETVSKTVTIK